MSFESSSGERGVVVWSHGRELLRVFRPQAWVVLQDLAFDAEWRDGRLVASSSARLVAAHLRIDPGTAAAALRSLRDRGVVELTQSSGVGGRFGLAAYTLLLPPGLEVLSSRRDEPRTAPPRTEVADKVGSVLHDPCSDTAHTVTSSPKTTTPDPPARPRRRRAAASVERSQGVLDLGTGES
jgi:hypothetical protein